MPCGRTVARLTRNTTVIAGHPPLCDILVALRAGGVTRVPGLPSHNRVDCGGAVMPDRAECGWNQIVTCYNQPGACHQENAE